MKKIILIILISTIFTNILSFDEKKHEQEKLRIQKRAFELSRQARSEEYINWKISLFKRTAWENKKTKKFASIKLTESNRYDVRRQLYELGEEECLTGDIKTCIHIGEMFMIMDSFNRSFSLFNFACMNRKSGESCHYVALHYLELSKKPNLNSAITYFQLACALGFKESCLYLDNGNEIQKMIEDLNNMQN